LAKYCANSEQRNYTTTSVNRIINTHITFISFRLLMKCVLWTIIHSILRGRLRLSLGQVTSGQVTSANQLPLVVGTSVGW
jgi:hypothetical protein